MAESFLHHLNIMDLLPAALVALRHGPMHSRSFPLTSGAGSIDEKMISYTRTGSPRVSSGLKTKRRWT